jgi:hypothetical protein
MRFASVVSVVCLLVGIGLGASPAQAQRLDGLFVVDDAVAPGSLDAEIVIDGTLFNTNGFAEGVGTGGDLVEIRFDTPFPTHVSANDVKGRVRQNRYAQLTLFISSTEGRSLDDTFSVEKCDVDGSVNVAQETGKVTVKCSSDGLWAGLTTAQVQSIQAAFAESSRVKIKVSTSNPTKGSISITIKGVGFED